MCIRGLQSIGVQNLGVLPEAQGRGFSGGYRQRRCCSGERDIGPGTNHQEIHGKAAEMEVGQWILRRPHITIFANLSVGIAGFI